MQGLMMFDTRAAITLLTKNWPNAYGLTVKEKVSEYILGAYSTVV